MKRGRGIKGLDDKSSGMEILMDDACAKINPIDPLILSKHYLNKQREENEIDPPVFH